MKKNAATALILAGSFLVGQSAMAESQTVSIGWAHGKIENANNLNGVNLQYRYEWNSPVSLVTSFTWMSGSEDNSWHDAWGDSYKQQVDTTYYSLLVGPAYRINEYVSLYGLIGAARTKTDVNYEWRNSVGADEPGGHKTINGSTDSTNFAYAAGISINPVENLAINIGYEGTRADFYGANYAINGFNVGVGYRF